MSPLSPEEKAYLLRLAREAIRKALAEGTKLDVALVMGFEPVSPRVREPSGAFVTLEKRGRLRGCIGYIQGRKPLDEAVIDCALSAAFQDPRFPPLSPDELDELNIEISVLSPLFEIRPEDVEVGKHGLLISLGAMRGLLLPQVATEWNWTREQFLEETCAKAGLEHDAWRTGARIEAFTALVFGESEADDRPATSSP